MEAAITVDILVFMILCAGGVLLPIIPTPCFARPISTSDANAQLVVVRLSKWQAGRSPTDLPPTPITNLTVWHRLICKGTASISPGHVQLYGAPCSRSSVLSCATFTGMDHTPLPKQHNLPLTSYHHFSPVTNNNMSTSRVGLSRLSAAKSSPQQNVLVEAEVHPTQIAHPIQVSG